MTSWSFLTSHARVLPCLARDPGARLRDLAASPDITERRTHGIVTDLTAAGYVIKQKDGRRNRYQVQAPLPRRTLSWPRRGCRKPGALHRARTGRSRSPAGSPARG